MRKLLTILLLSLVLAPAAAQNSKKVKDLKNQKTRLEKDLKKSQNDLTKTRSDVKKGQVNLRYLDQEIEVRVRYIHETEHELDSLEVLVDSVTAEIHYLDSVLSVKKEKYTHALRMAQAYRKVNSSLLFALSAKDVTQMYRRLRYTRQYASYERMLGEQVQAKQIELLERQNQLLGLKSEMNRKMQVLVEERAKLSRQQVEQQTQVNALQKKAKDLQQQVANKQAEITALQKKIDQVIAYEIEQARKKAEEERRRKEAEAKKKAAAAAAKNKQTPAKTAPATSKSTTPASTSKWLTPEEQKLNGSFAQNKGRLPVPITGEYMIGARYGANTSGHSHVVLSNKGTNYVGRQGARARTVFDGEVAAVFALSGMKHVLVRHGSYITVYCNLSSVIVRKGQKVKARDLLGTVANDGSGQYVLHFQLRKETSLLNPEAWIGR
ncbi:MAG: peptidoglycan DD-metalloendopeptidase family protein [Bacteroidaceae bacterium]|nr:peptidoglycan DD-metalloendopeptidase family protein [Bacteroidaceae bacterium]